MILDDNNILKESQYPIKMLIKLENASLLTRVVEIISELVTEVKIRIDEKGMGITAMDPANVSMVNFKKRFFAV